MDLRNLLMNLDKDENKIALYNNYKKPIFLFILGIVKNHHESEDITEEVFIRVFKYHESYNEFKNPKTWLYTIAKNAAYTAIKKNMEIPTCDLKLEYLFNKHNIISTVDSLIVTENLSYLNKVERSIMLLHIFAGLTHLEISKVLDINYSYVRAKYNRARKKLKERLEQDEKQRSRG